MNNNTFKISKGEAKQIIKEEVQRVLLELDNPSSIDLREMIQKAIANLEEHADLIKEIAYVISSDGNNQKDLIELVKSHGVYMGMLERILEDLR